MSLTSYEEVHIFEDFGIIAGAYKRLSFQFQYPNGNLIPLGSVVNYGCVFSLYGNEDTSLFNIIGTIDPASDGNIMLIDILGGYTEGLSNCKLVYQPYIIDLDRTYLPGQGYMSIFAAIIFDQTSIVDLIQVQTITLLDQWQVHMNNTLAEAESVIASFVPAENQRVSNEDDRITAENARKVFETYNNVKAYIIGNKVSYNGSSYSCILNTTDNLPTNETYWLLISQKGDMGNVMYATFDYDALSGNIIMHAPDEFSGATFLMNEDGEIVVRVGV